MPGLVQSQSRFSPVVVDVDWGRGRGSSRGQCRTLFEHCEIGLLGIQSSYISAYKNKGHLFCNEIPHTDSEVLCLRQGALSVHSERCTGDGPRLRLRSRSRSRPEEREFLSLPNHPLQSVVVLWRHLFLRRSYGPETDHTYRTPCDHPFWRQEQTGFNSGLLGLFLTN